MPLTQDVSKSSVDIPKIVIDGVFFQISQTSGIARVWQSLLSVWAQQGLTDHFVLIDRGGTLPSMGDYETVLLPICDYRYSPQESEALQSICERIQADLFVSSYYSTPLSTPSALLVHDMIPEVLGMDLSEPCWREKRYSILHASRHIAVSQNTAKDLVRFYSHLRQDDIPIVPCGVSDGFTPVSESEIQAFRRRYHLSRPFVLLLGERFGGKSYKNVLTFFRALAQADVPINFDVVCVGGKTHLEEELATLNIPCPVHLLSLNDQDLRLAYGAAIAFIYPTRYEGFGLPVLEAMACGCPVIVGNHSSIPEVAGEAGYYVDVMDMRAWLGAIQQVQDPEQRQRLIRQGFERVKQFSWSKMAHTLLDVWLQTVSELRTGQRPSPSPFWTDLRQQQKSLSSLRQDFDNTQRVVTDLKTELTPLKEELDAIKSSRFWRLHRLYRRAKFW